MSKVIFHIGTPKTGTTYLQNTLAKNREILGRSKVGYHQIPGSLCACHWWFALPFYDHIEDYCPAKIEMANGISGDSLIDRGKRSQDFCRGELRDFDVVIISAEQFFFLPLGILQKIKTFFDGEGAFVQVVVYVRNPIGAALSEVNQKVKMGMAALSYMSNNLVSFDTHKGVQRFVEVFGRDSILVKNYDDICLSNIDIVDDFVKSCLAEHQVFSMVKDRPINLSLSHEALWIIDEYNKLFPDDPPESPRRNLVIEALSKVKGGKFYVQNEVLQGFKQKLAEELEYLEKEWGIKFDGNPDVSGHDANVWSYEDSFRSVANVMEVLLNHVSLGAKERK